MSDALKHDGGKVPLHLLPAESLVEIAKVLDFGAKKYAAHGWRHGMDWSRLNAALLRHLYAWQMGEDVDPESGQLHLAHAGCCLLFLLSYQKTGVGKDDRWPVEVRA